MPEATAQVETPRRKKTRKAPRVIMGGVSWRDYCRVSRALEHQPGVRLTYDRGTLEIMSPLFRHDWSSRLIALMVVALTDELGLPVIAGGTATLRRKLKQKGIEADESFWIANEHKIRGKKRLNLAVDPPPDLAVEVDETKSSLNRLGIYAALRVPEVWRCEEDTIIFYVLNDKNEYDVSPSSLAFPGLTGADLMPFLQLNGKLEFNEILRQFRQWIRQRFNIPPKS